MSVNDILWLLSGDTTVMFELLADNVAIVRLAEKVAHGSASYKQLLQLTYTYF